MPIKNFATTVSVSWGYDVEVSIRLTLQDWTTIKSGKPLQISGKGYHYEGEFFEDNWHFGGGLEGPLLVTYGDDGGVGFDGRLCDANIEEHPSSQRTRKRSATK